MQAVIKTSVSLEISSNGSSLTSEIRFFRLVGWADLANFQYGPSPIEVGQYASHAACCWLRGTVLASLARLKG